MVESDGNYRYYRVPQCGKSYSLADLQPVFAAHSVEWSIMGRDMPWYSVLTDERYKTEKPSRLLLNRFYESGKLHVQRVLNDVGLQSELSGKSVLDLGCGVGRLALEFARRGASVACVDQSVFHLALARQQLPKHGLSSPEVRDSGGSVQYLVNTPDLIASLGGRRFDLVHSVIVLQHAVAPIQAALMQQMCDVLRVGGVGWVQVPWKVGRGSPDSCDLEASIGQGGMQMHASPMDAIRAAFHARGCNATVDDIGGEFVDASPNPTHRSALVKFRRMVPWREAGHNVLGVPRLVLRGDRASSRDSELAKLIELRDRQVT